MIEAALRLGKGLDVCYWRSLAKVEHDIIDLVSISVAWRPPRVETSRMVHEVCIHDTQFSANAEVNEPYTAIISFTQFPYLQIVLSMWSSATMLPTLAFQPPRIIVISLPGI